MFPKHTFSTTRFLLIITCLTLSPLLFQFINNTDTNILFYSLSIVLFSLAFWSIFTFLGLIDRVERVEKYTKHFQDGIALTNNQVNWRKVPHNSRNLEEQRAALNYYRRVFNRADAFSHIIFYVSLGVYCANYSNPNMMAIYFGIMGTLMAFIGFLINLYLLRRKKALQT